MVSSSSMVKHAWLCVLPYGIRGRLSHESAIQIVLVVIVLDHDREYWVDFGETLAEMEARGVGINNEVSYYIDEQWTNILVPG